MKISITAKLKAKQELVKKLDETHYEVFVKVAPIEGKANQAIIKAMAEYLNLPQSKIQIIHGLTSRQKILEIV